MDQTPRVAPWSWRAFVLPALLLALGGASLWADLSVSLWCLADRCPGTLRKLFDVTEVFGHGTGVVLILMAIYVLDPARRWGLPRVAACAYGAGMAANVLKLLISRVRPRNFAFDTDVWSTFSHWFPLWNGGFGGQSFPSAHTATAVGLAFGLVWLYPRGRVLFPVLVVLVAAQRIDSSSHYLSDVLVGASVGMVIGEAMTLYGRLPSLFDRLEARWRFEPTLLPMPEPATDVCASCGRSRRAA